MNKNKFLGLMGVVFLLLVGLFYAFVNNQVFQEGVLTYANEIYGISFSYPETYELLKGEVGNAERGHYAIVLTRREDLPPPENGEGPPTITFDIYQNNLDNISLIDWLMGTNDSNFKLSDGTYASTTVSGKEAVRYLWDGLYQGKSIAFLHRDRIVMVSEMYLSAQDSIKEDFERVVSSIVLQ